MINVTTFLASFLIWLMFFAMVIFWVFRKDLKAPQFIHILAIIITTLMVSQFIKEIIPSQRPFVIDGSIPLTVTVPKDNAFPSTHTAAAFAMTFGLMYHDRKIGSLFLPPALLVGVGRVMSHVHFPIDVLGGIVIALVVSWLYGDKRVISIFQKR